MNSTDTHSRATDLAATLVQIAHDKGSSIERLRAEQLLAEACQARRGEVETMWATWLAEGAKSLGLRARTARVSVKEALDLAKDGALLVCYSPESKSPVIVSSNGNEVEALHPKKEPRQRNSWVNFFSGSAPRL